MSIKSEWKLIGTNRKINCSGEQWQFSYRDRSYGITTGAWNSIGDDTGGIKDMSIKSEWKLIGTNRKINCSGEQWQFSYRDRSYGITTGAWNSIGDDTGGIKDMSIKSEWKLIGTNRKINCSGEQWQFSYRDRSYGITTGAWNSIGDDTGGIKDMSIKSEWKLIGTNRKINCSGEQWQFSYRDRSYGITTGAWNSIGDDTGGIKDMSIKSEWKLIGTNRKINCSGEQWQFSYRDRSYGITTGAWNSIGDDTGGIKDMSIKSEWKLIGTNRKINCSGEQWQFSYRDRSYGITTGAWNSIGDDTGSIKDMSNKSEWKLIGTNRKINGSSEQWQFSYRDRSYGITTGAWNSIGDDTGGIKDMSIKSEWKLIGTNRKINCSGEQWQFSYRDRSYGITTGAWNSIGDDTGGIKDMSIKSEWKLIGTNRKINCSGEQWQFSYRDRSYGITTGAWNSIGDDTGGIKDMSIKSEWKLIGTNRKINCSGEQWQFSYRDRSYGITTGAWNSIGDDTGGIKDMSIKSEWKLIGTNRKINCSGEQWQFSYRDRSYGITTGAWNSIGDDTGGIKDMSIKSEWKLIGTNRKINCSGEQWQFSNCNGSYGITTGAWNSIGDDTGGIKDMSIKSEWELIGTNRKINCSGEQWQFSYRNRSYGITTGAWNSIGDDTGGIKDMSIKSEWELIGTNRLINCSGEQLQFSYRNRSYGITTGAWNSIGDDTGGIKDMSIKSEWKLIGTNRKINCSGEQWKFSYRNRSYGIRNGAVKSIGDDIGGISDMSIKSEWKLIGTNRKINCSSEQWQFSYRNRSYGITTGAWNSIGDDTGGIKDMSIKSEWKLIGTNRKINCSGEQWINSYRNRSYGITTGAWNSIGDDTGGIKDMSIKSEWELIGTNRKINCSGEQWYYSYRDRSYGITTGAWNSIGDDTGGIKDMSIKSEWKLIGTNRKINCSGEQWQFS